LADLGETAKANTYLDRMSSETAGHGLRKNAAARRADPVAKCRSPALGCH